MDGAEKYQVINRIAGHDIVAFSGTRIVNGQRVLLHQLAATSDHTNVLKLALQYLLRKPVGGRILDLVEIGGVHYVVTEDTPDCLALRDWLSWELSGAEPAASRPLSHEPGEFTKQFQKDAPGSGTARGATGGASSTEPGEFTRHFRDAAHMRPSEPAASVPGAHVTPLPVTSEGKQAGEFTRLFRTPLPQPMELSREPLPKTPPASQSPGEFTRIFGNRTPPGAPVPPSAAPAPPPPASVPYPGALTESLDPHGAPTRAPSVAGPAAGPGEFTRVIRGSGDNRAPGPLSPVASSAPAVNVSVTPPAVPSIPAVSAPSMPSVPSTPVPAVACPSMPTLQAPQVSTPVPAPTPAGGPGLAQPASAGRRLALIILFVVLLVGALVLIGLVVFRS